MSRAWQTPHGARPNRKEVRDLGFGHVPARCVKPSGRSLEPRSDARPRGMAVQQEQSRGQNSAYRSGCLKSTLFSAICFLEPPNPGIILVSVNEQSKNAVNAESDQIVSGGDLFQKGLVESSRKFWSGERPLSVIHWTGIALLYIGVGVFALT